MATPPVAEAAQRVAPAQVAAEDWQAARRAYDKALAIDALDSVQRGFAHLDRARAALMGGNATMASDQLERARAGIERARGFKTLAGRV